MTTPLIQHVGASPPTLPGKTVLRYDAALEPGVLLHDLGSEQSLLYCRLMFNTSQASGGTLTIAGGIDASEDYIWQLVVDPDTQSITLAVGEAQSAVDYAGGIDWHTAEVGLDKATGLATLRIDGIERTTITETFNGTRYAWLGGAFPGSGLIGSVDLDQWELATDPIGIARSSPQAEHAGDPRRWLVIYNRNSSDSALWADAYRARRGVPYTNLCGLDLPSAETISAAEYELLRQQVNDYLDDNSLRDQILGVMLGFGVPGYADVAGQGTLTPIAAYLHTDDMHGLPVINPLYQEPVTTRPYASSYSAVRLTGRIDAASLSDALAILDRADAVLSQPLTHDGLADVLIDINPANPNVGPVYTDPVDEWASGTGLARLRLPATIYDTNAPATAGGESVVWGWRDAAPPSGFFASPAGRRALCVQLDPEPQPAVSARTPSATDWLSMAMQAGYAAAAAPSRAYSLSSAPLPHRFFEALRLGWTLAEAWAVAQPFLRDGLQILGDPLMSIGFPKAGYDVFGPADRLDQIDLDQPLAILHAGQTEYQLDSADAPQSGSPARYLVRRLDDEGRSDFTSSATFAAVEQDQVVRPALPAWPNRDGWRMSERDGQINITGVWCASLRSLDVHSVELQSQVGTDSPALAERVEPKVGQSQVSFKSARPMELTRYRLRINQGPATFDSPWSQWVAPAPAPTAALNVLEIS